MIDVEHYKTNQHQKRHIWCNVHGPIYIENMAVKIIDTPEFQRMRFIKQLGMCQFVFPSAVTTRFEHSLGVYHLTGRVLSRIMKLYPNKKYFIPELGNIELTETWVECIKIAGLCHDIGHGPFSHVFDSYLAGCPVRENANHEDRSCLITEILCKRELNGILDDNHIEFIKTIIQPPRDRHGPLYQIVANNMNTIDVDKFDYLTRDCKNIGINSNFNYTRLIDELILDDNDNLAYPEDVLSDIYEMFHTRYMMHKKIYNHKSTIAIDNMVLDIFRLIDPVLKLSESVLDMKKFCLINDNTIFCYLDSCGRMGDNADQIDDARNIYSRIIRRDFYKQISIYRKIVSRGDHTGNRDAEIEFYNYIDKMASKGIDPKNFIINKRLIGSDTYQGDPFAKIFLYDKTGSVRPVRPNEYPPTPGFGLIESCTQLLYKYTIQSGVNLDENDNV